MRFLTSWFFHKSVSPTALSIPDGPFRIIAIIPGDIRISRCTTGVIKTGGKWKKSSIRNNYLCTYDLYSPVHNVLDACISITRGSGRGLGPGARDFLGPMEMHRADRRVPFGALKTRHVCVLEVLNTTPISMHKWFSHRLWQQEIILAHTESTWKWFSQISQRWEWMQ
jgi:hypothetical protein